MTIREPEYDDRDRALILSAWIAEQEPRNSDGILISDATNPKLQTQWEARSRRDYAARALKRTQKEYEALYPHDDLDSLLWRVQRKESGAEDL